MKTLHRPTPWWKWKAELSSGDRERFCELQGFREKQRHGQYACFFAIRLACLFYENWYWVFRFPCLFYPYTHDGSMVLLYMVTWIPYFTINIPQMLAYIYIPYMDPIHKYIYIYNGFVRVCLKMSQKNHWWIIIFPIGKPFRGYIIFSDTPINFMCMCIYIYMHKVIMIYDAAQVAFIPLLIIMN